MLDLSSAFRWMSLALLLLSLAATNNASAQVVRLSFISRDSTPRYGRPRTELTIDLDRQQVGEVRHLTTALGNRITDTTVWGPDNKGFNPGSTSTCFISDANNFVCRVRHKDMPNELVPKGFGSELRMHNGDLFEISGADTISYRRLPK